MPLGRKKGKGKVKRAEGASKKIGSGGAGQAASALRKQRRERQKALKELLGS